MEIRHQKKVFIRGALILVPLSLFYILGIKIAPKISKSKGFLWLLGKATFIFVFAGILPILHKNIYQSMPEARETASIILWGYYGVYAFLSILWFLISLWIFFIRKNNKN
ncbi:MAG: hypothetical protein DRO88_10530 [Promethearchaeia archaeon]|nr:MAG: hypothetical protein DRO88_10530 [Candidatus Lokiarchaeia archaeon]